MGISDHDTTHTTLNPNRPEVKDDDARFRSRGVISRRNRDCQACWQDLGWRRRMRGSLAWCAAAANALSSVPAQGE